MAERYRNEPEPYRERHTIEQRRPYERWGEEPGSIEWRERGYVATEPPRDQGYARPRDFPTDRGWPSGREPMFRPRGGNASENYYSPYGTPEPRSEPRLGRFFGRGPKGYKRSDDRIREDVCDRLTDDPTIDATDMEVSVKDGEVKLLGTVDGRAEKRRAEDIVENVAGVRDVHNQLRVTRDRRPQKTDSTSGSE
jgi:hypothetical protein